jgi:hypothetical protein
MMGVVYHTGNFISSANTQQPTVVSNGDLIKCSTGVAVSVLSFFSVAQSQSLLLNLNSLPILVCLQ